MQRAVQALSPPAGTLRAKGGKRAVHGAVDEGRTGAGMTRGFIKKTAKGQNVIQNHYLCNKHHNYKFDLNEI